MEKTCKTCGIIFNSPYPTTKYCCEKCQREGTKIRMRKYMGEYWKKHPDKYEQLLTRSRKYPNNHRKGPLPHDPNAIIRDTQKFELLPKEVQDKIKSLVDRQQPKPNMRQIRLDNKCSVCGRGKGIAGLYEPTNRYNYGKDVFLLVHHITYYPEETTTLCGSCHGYLNMILRKKEREKRKEQLRIETEKQKKSAKEQPLPEWIQNALKYNEVS